MEAGSASLELRGEVQTGRTMSGVVSTWKICKATRWGKRATGVSIAREEEDQVGWTVPNPSGVFSWYAWFWRKCPLGGSQYQDEDEETCVP